MADYQVTCIRRDGFDADRRIDRLGGIAPNGRIWNDSIDNVISSIAHGHRFWTRVNNISVWIEVRKHPKSGRLYLATESDGFPPNNLLSLPECP